MGFRHTGGSNSQSDIKVKFKYNKSYRSNPEDSGELVIITALDMNHGVVVKGSGVGWHGPTNLFTPLEGRKERKEDRLNK